MNHAQTLIGVVESCAILHEAFCVYSSYWPCDNKY